MNIDKRDDVSHSERSESIFSRLSPKRVWKIVVGEAHAPFGAAAALGVGIFVGLLPVMPFQTAIAIALAFVFRLNRLITLAGTLIWQPFTFPFIIAAEHRVGSWILPRGAAIQPEGIWAKWGFPVLIGSVPFAAACGLAVALLVYPLLKWRAGEKNRCDRAEG